MRWSAVQKAVSVTIVLTTALSLSAAGACGGTGEADDFETNPPRVLGREDADSPGSGDGSRSDSPSGTEDRYVTACDGRTLPACASFETCPEAQCGLNDFWLGRAKWQFIRSYPASLGINAEGTHIYAQDNVWYLFSRKIFSAEGTACAAIGVRLGVQVRQSRDRGVTWGPPTDFIVPTPGTPWECMGTDGDVYLDAASGTWHYLFQCLGPSGAWNGCHVQRKAADPMGPWSAIGANPVINSGALWGAICNDPSDDCVSLAAGRKLTDEGTFNIFHSDPTGAVYVSFHGYDGKRGYRGIARTTADFQTWIAGNPALGVPADAIFDWKDTVNWRENWKGGPVGGGAGSILQEKDGYFYLAVEAADIDLLCTKGQNWDIGLLRSKSLTATTWEQLPQRNPFFYSSHVEETPGTGDSPACNPSYNHLFRDPKTKVTYITHHRFNSNPTKYYDAMNLFQLVPDRNLLANGDLWKCGSDDWKITLGGTNLVVYRSPHRSSDENCYLATNCGAATCTPGQGVFQDVDLPAGRTKIAFGGAFATEGGSGGVVLGVHELDGAKKLVRSHALTVVVTEASWARVRDTFVRDPATKSLRYQIHLISPSITVRADEMFIE